MSAVEETERFTVRLVIWVSPSQDAMLEKEVYRRKQAKETSEVAAARGMNRNVNSGMLIREAIERQFGGQ